MSDATYGQKCDHDPCHCKTEAATAVVDGKTVFCSKGCAEGKGCSAPECNCSELGQDSQPDGVG